MIGRLLLPNSLCGSILGKNGLATSRSRFRWRCLVSRRRLHGEGMEMPKRQRKLEDERQQRQPRAELQVFSKPIHAALRSPGTAQAPQLSQRYFIAWKTDCNNAGA